MAKRNGEILHLCGFSLHMPAKQQQHHPFPSPFWIPRTNTNPCALQRWIQTPHVWLGWTEHPAAAEIDGRDLFTPSLLQLRSLWNIATCKDAVPCFVLRYALSRAEIHHAALPAATEGNLAFSVFPSRSLRVRVATSAQQCWVPLLHQYLNCPFALQPPKYPIHYQSRGARAATTGGSPGWCLLKLQQKSLAGWTQAFRSEEQCKVSVMKCTNTGSPHSSGARSLHRVFLRAYFSSNTIQSLLDYTVYLPCLVGTLICFKLPKCSLWNA